MEDRCDVNGCDEVGWGYDWWFNIRISLCQKHYKEWRELRDRQRVELTNLYVKFTRERKEWFEKKRVELVEAKKDEQKRVVAV